MKVCEGSVSQTEVIHHTLPDLPLSDALHAFARPIDKDHKHEHVRLDNHINLTWKFDRAK